MSARNSLDSADNDLHECHAVLSASNAEACTDGLPILQLCKFLDLLDGPVGQDVGKDGGVGQRLQQSQVDPCKAVDNRLWEGRGGTG